MNDHQCEAMTTSGRRCRRMGRLLCDTHSGAQAARKARYGNRGVFATAVKRLQDQAAATAVRVLSAS